jgi:hypothetical protein
MAASFKTWNFIVVEKFAGSAGTLPVNYAVFLFLALCRKGRLKNSRTKLSCSYAL